MLHLQEGFIHVGLEATDPEGAHTSSDCHPVANVLGHGWLLSVQLVDVFRLQYSPPKDVEIFPLLLLYYLLGLVALPVVLSEKSQRSFHGRQAGFLLFSGVTWPSSPRLVSV